MSKQFKTTLIAAAIAAVVPFAANAAPKKSAKAADTVPAASQAQLQAANQVLAGRLDCEFAQAVDVAQSGKNPGYFDVKFNKAHYLMKPVVSNTGAVRLESVKGDALLIQIATKSMLMNPKSGQRLVDGCMHPSQKGMRTAQQ